MTVNWEIYGGKCSWNILSYYHSTFPEVLRKITKNLGQNSRPPCWNLETFPIWLLVP